MIELPKKCFVQIILIVLTTISLNACSSNSVKRDIRTPEHFLDLDPKADYLKVHFRDGRLSILSEWRSFEKERYIIGSGFRYDANRTSIGIGTDTIQFAKIALLETNVVQSGEGLVGMAVLTGGTLAMAIFCAENPKACFGSCPTFYAWDGKYFTLMAEGFSSSVLPILEERDIDALYTSRPASRNFELRMTNEALETHLIRYADLLIAKRPEGGRIVHMTNNSLRQAFSFYPPATCIAPEGDIRLTILSFDTIERFSPADSNDLAAKETIELSFDEHPGMHKGLTLGFRQSLLTTYLFYQGLAYLGDSAVKFMAMLESHPEMSKLLGDPFGRNLGGIEISVLRRSGGWIRIGDFYETGPIAQNVQTIAIPDSLSECTKIRMRMTKGMWRINYISLASLGDVVTPTRLHPVEVISDTGKCPDALAKLQSGTSHLVSMPGEKWILKYELPENYSDYEILLDSKGYYLEWMRKEWLAETNPEKAAIMLAFPSLFLKQEAPMFKKLEPSMENTFWSSKYVRH
jgi:hypothetical protein